MSPGAGSKTLSRGRPTGGEDIAVIGLESVFEPAPGDMSQQSLIAEFVFELGPDVGDQSELPLPFLRSAGIVEDDDAAGGQFLDGLTTGAQESLVGADLGAERIGVGG